MRALVSFVMGLALCVSSYSVQAKPKRHVVTQRLVADNPLALTSEVAYVVDQDTNEVVFQRGHDVSRSIASITKLMTALIVTEHQLPMDEVLTITKEDVDTYKGTGSRLPIGTQLSRGEMMTLALMASENRAANALGRHFPGGLAAFVEAMNTRAIQLGMIDTNYEEPTGLSYKNKSSAKDLIILVRHAYDSPLIRALSTTQEHTVNVFGKPMTFRTTNRLVAQSGWEIGLQKTGFIKEAGLCLVMQVQEAGRNLIMVVLHSTKPGGRFADAEKLRKAVKEKTP